MSTFLLFKTKKTEKAGKEESNFVGQTGDTSLPNVSKITKKVTNEAVTNVSKKEGSVTGVTENFYVDFVPKDAFKAGEIPL
jgi:hypothetical protein